MSSEKRLSCDRDTPNAAEPQRTLEGTSSRRIPQYRSLLTQRQNVQSASSAVSFARELSLRCGPAAIGEPRSRPRHRPPECCLRKSSVLHKRREILENLNVGFPKLVRKFKVGCPTCSTARSPLLHGLRFLNALDALKTFVGGDRLLILLYFVYLLFCENI